MKIYVSFLKMLGLLLLIPVFIGIVWFLFLAGLGMDISNSWGNSSSGLYGFMFILPLGFIIGSGWLLHRRSVRRSQSQEEAYEAQIRQQVVREQQLGSTIEENIVNLLRQKGSLSAEELVRLCNTDQEEVIMTLRKLLQAGAVHQRIQQEETVFYVEPKRPS